MESRTVTRVWRICIIALFAFGICSVRISGQEERKRLSSPQPQYPELARRMNLSGSVKVEIVIDANGEIRESRVLGGHPLLAEAALKALRDWKFSRANSETRLQIEFKFHY
jgi:TonB family protein